MTNKSLIAVDLDGTLIDKSILQVIVEKIATTHRILDTTLPLVYLLIFKTNQVTSDFIQNNIDILNLDNIETNEIALNLNVIRYLLNVKHLNTLALATGSDQYTCEVMGAFFKKYFGLTFEYMIGSQNGEFSISETKLEKLKKISSKFSYIGNSYQDLPIWKDESVDVVCVGNVEFFDEVRSLTSKSNCILISDEFRSSKECYSQIFPDEYSK
jgi:hypothetical protein